MVEVLIGRQYPLKLIEIIDQSKSSIKILMYDWRWYSHQPGSLIQKLNQSIIRARKRGVEVTALLNHGGIKDTLKENKINVKVRDSSKTMHIKLIIIDDQKMFLGSHNLSINAFHLNYEMSLFLDDIESVKKCLTFFNQLCHL